MNGANGGEGEYDATLGYRWLHRIDLLQYRKAGEIGDAHNVFVANRKCSLGMILVLLVVDTHVVIDSTLLLNHITSDLGKSDGSIFSDRCFLVAKCAI